MKVAGFEVACPVAQAYAEQADREYPAESIPYMPPEFLKGEKLDARSDQFSLAAIAFLALTGTRPFQASSTVALLRQVMFEKPTLGKLRDRFPLAVLKVFEAALSGTPSARYGSCSEFVSALDAAIVAPESAAAATRLATPMPESLTDARPGPAAAPAVQGSSKWLVWVVGLVILAGLAALAVKLFSPTPPVVDPVTPPKNVVAQPVPPPSNPAPEPAATTSAPAAAPPKTVPRPRPGKPKTSSKSIVSGGSGAQSAPEPPAASKQPSQEKAAPAVTPPPAESTPSKPPPVKLAEPKI
ncbi:MAG: hypothetical protein ACRD5L_04080 [Bryobacteraceae bacterium]